MQIVYERGRTWRFDEIGPNSIALDGAVQGPQIDAANRRYSFDHHDGCLRLVTLATCQQVRTALRLGLPVDAETKVYVNDWDADTILSVWLLANPDRINDGTVVHMVNEIGERDAHGPAMGMHPMHANINPAYGDVWGMEKAEAALKRLTRFLAGEYVPTSRMEEDAQGMALTRAGAWEPVNAGRFADLYRDGYVAAVLTSPAEGGTTRYTVAKASDLVPLDIRGALVQLRTLELQRNPAQLQVSNWGGGSTIGGSPRNADGTSSVLTIEDVCWVVKP